MLPIRFGGSVMTTTYMRIDKEEFRVIYKALRKLLEQGNLSEYSFDREISEHLMEEIQKNIFFCGTTRKNWQVVDWNDPAGKSFSKGRKQYDHYGDFE